MRKKNSKLPFLLFIGVILSPYDATASVPPNSPAATKTTEFLQANGREDANMASRSLQSSDFSCPAAGNAPVTFSASGTLNVDIVPAGTLCTLTIKKIVNEEDVIIPLGRSYDNHPWETVAGPFPITFTCSGSSCSSSTLPVIDGDSVFQLTTFDVNDRGMSNLDIVARFLEQTTFGPTRSSLDPWRSMESATSSELDYSFAEWVKNQIDVVPTTSHRAYFRKRAASVIDVVHMLGTPPHPCSAGSRWRKYAFTTRDANTVSLVHQQPVKMRVVGAGEAFKNHLTVGGKIRTEITNLGVLHGWNQVGDLWGGQEYEVCYGMTQEQVGGTFRVRWNGACVDLEIGNPEVKFTTATLPNIDRIVLSEDDYEKIVPLPGTTRLEEFILTEDLINPKCDELEIEDYPVFLDFNNGTFLSFDPRITPKENTLENPLTDGGGEQKTHGSFCSNAPRTFLNSKHCKISSDANACSDNTQVPDANTRLTTETLSSLFEITGKYVYAVNGLRVEESPCVYGKASRWSNIGPSSDCPSNYGFSASTYATLQNELQTNAYLENNLREFKFWDTGECDIPSTTPSDTKDIKVAAQNACWLLVHPDHHSVFDMSPWVTQHPGGAEKITMFADSGSVFLEYPNWHEMWRWNLNRGFIGDYVGVYDQLVNLQDFPESLQTKAVATALGGDATIFYGKAAVCGSPNEVAYDSSADDSFFSFDLGYWDRPLTAQELTDQKQVVWANIVMNAEDQLRQRMAWALAQIFAIAPTTVEEQPRTEGFTAYYDIFVRHAFGNYFDILREVSYSAFMAEMLTYLFSKSSAFILKRLQQYSFADENFAREIMQLFTIGTTMMNMDGSPILDEATGEPKLTYTNEHIMSFARAWTGYIWYDVRANVDQVFGDNRLDPMKIEGEWRDKFPKINLLDGYIGDGIPLCVDIPDRHFLRKGATYRVLGSNPKLEVHSPPIHEYREFDITGKVFTLEADSTLYSKLCDPTTPGGTDCNFPGEVTLDENIPCYGRECLVDTLRLLEVTDGIYYEYVRQSCVQLPFYQNPKRISYRFNHIETCADPRMDVAGDICCLHSLDYQFDKHCEYTQERVKYSTAEQRCANIGQSVCNIGWFTHDETCEPGCCEFSYVYQWTAQSCTLKAKVDSLTGKITLVHFPPSEVEFGVPQHLLQENINYFPVYWNSDEYPNLSNNCGNGACEVVDESCVCSTLTVNEEAVFSSAPNSVQEIVDALHIGIVSPDTFDDGDYGSPITSGDIKIYFKNGVQYDINTIFEVNVLTRKRFFKNMRSTVEVRDPDSNNIAYSFRNPPHFMSLLDPEADSRDAQHETDAVLRHYLEHPNTPPFLAIYFIQRFGVSNPSPLYIKEVATAFKTGIYTYDDISIGSGKYADLGATVAAVILYREARSVTLDFDPTKGSLREPILKVIAVMRAMEYEAFKTYDDHSLSTAFPGSVVDKLYKQKGTQLIDMTAKIGQMVYDPDSIFSFFRREYSPEGPVRQANLVSPDAQRYSSPKVIGIINGLLSLIKYGLSECDKGFGHALDVIFYDCAEGEHLRSWGKLEYTPQDPDDSESVVDEMSTLLTAGRLNPDSRALIKSEYDKASDNSAGLRIAQQLMVSSPEFHSTSLMKFNGEERVIPEPELSDGSSDFKAVVYLMLEGGFDTYNMLVPLSGCDKDMYNEYRHERGSVGLGGHQLLHINTGNTQQICSSFGVHKDLPVLQSLYNSDDLAFFANVGYLFEPVNKENWQSKTGTQLFAHNIQQRDAQQLDPFKQVDGTGVLGRMADALHEEGYSVGAYSISGETYSLVGEGKAPSTNQVDPWEDPVFNPNPSYNDMDSLMFDINNPTTSDSGFFGKTWSNLFESSVKRNDRLREALQDSESQNSFPNSHFGRSLEKIAKILKVREELGDDRQLFHVGHQGYDSHGDQIAYLEELLIDLNTGLDAFVKEVKSNGMWGEVVLVMVSDFGRTLTPNSSDGTDHGWGGNYFVFGESVKGGEIFGEYPDNLTEEGPLNVGRGRFIPTTSWDAIFNGVSQWLGISTTEALNRVLPNREKFPLYESSDIFVGGDPSPPTGSPPTGSPPTGSPPTGSPPTGSPPTGSPPTPSSAIWVPVAGQGGDFDSIGDTMTDADFRPIWASSPNKILKRLCSNCAATHEEIYYRRFDVDGILPPELDLLHLVKNSWVQSQYNNFYDFMGTVNFALYSTYNDAVADTNRWTFCNFSANIGFPADCGPTGIVTNNWNNFINHAFGKRDVGFYVEHSQTSSPTTLSQPTNLPTQLPTKSPTSTPTKLPTQLPTQLPTKLPTLSPSLTPQSPTKAPSNTTSPTKAPTDTTTPTKAPIDTTTPTKVPSNTLSPTLRPTREDLWYIDSANVVFDINGTIPQMKISHDVGRGTDFIDISLFEFDCSTPIPESDATYLVSNDTVFSSGVAKYTVEFDTSNLNSSVATTGNNVRFCTKLELYDVETGLSISFRKQRFSFELDTTASFFMITVNIQESDIDSFELGSIAFYGVNACQCQTSFTCDSLPTVLEQNSEVSICVAPSPSGVNFNDFNVSLIGDNGFSYSPVVTDDNGQQQLFTGTTVETQGLITRITTRLITALFDDESRFVIVQGRGRIQFPPSKQARKNSISEKKEEEESQQREFELSILIDSVSNSSMFNVTSTTSMNPPDDDTSFNPTDTSSPESVWSSIVAFFESIFSELESFWDVLTSLFL